jgi:membrane protease YdiL (CAAX protease family)
MKTHSSWSQVRLLLLYLVLELSIKQITLFVFLDSINGSSSATSQKIGELSLVDLIVYVVILGPIIEEITFRGMAQNLLYQCLKWLCKDGNRTLQPWAIIASAMAFALAHEESYTVFFLNHLTFGLFAGHLYARTNKLRWPIALHSLNTPVHCWQCTYLVPFTNIAA